MKSERTLAVEKAYRKSDNGKARRRAAQAKYQKTEKGKLSAKKFRSKYVEPDHLREARRVRGRAYNKSPRGRAVRVHHAATRRALKKGANLSELKLISNWFTRWKAASWVRCYWCRKWFRPKNCHADHIVPLTKEGPHSIENVCVACGPCNRKKQDKLPLEWNEFIIEPVLL